MTTIIRGTTPRHDFFNIPVNKDSIEEVWITYAHRNGMSLTLMKSEGKVIVLEDKITDDPNKCILSVDLTQSDTLSFKPGDGSVQIRLLTNEGEAMASQEIPFKVERVLKDGTIK